ncbi:Uncharacterised protein [Mycobacteroides abscessus subsp. abscessus]|nr:Uncharacterised protein [Mycobacteroides abscessus subsp. abscessus]
MSHPISACIPVVLVAAVIFAVSVSRISAAAIPEGVIAGYAVSMVLLYIVSARISSVVVLMS